MCMGKCLCVWVNVYVYRCVSMCLGEYLSLRMSVLVYG
jgi:hypothetical protein